MVTYNYSDSSSYKLVFKQILINDSLNIEAEEGILKSYPKCLSSGAHLPNVLQVQLLETQKK